MSRKVVHFEIPADDLDRARDFYAGAFGWEPEPMPGAEYMIVNTVVSDEKGMPQEPGSINGGITSRQSPVTNPLVVIDVEDIDVALLKIESLGGKTVQKRQPVGDVGFNGYFTDPEGNTLGLWQQTG